MSIGATALRRPHLHRTIPPGASWHGRGMPVRAAIDGWPLRPLTEPPIKVLAKPAWDDFPEGLRGDVDDYFAWSYQAPPQS